MQSRLRKIQRCEADNETVEKQLCNNFEVYEYLQENHPEIDNIQLYAKLLNNLIVQKDERKAKLQQFGATSKFNQPALPNTPAAALMEMHERTSKEMEISSNLEREIVETKKSLNLLKGDIGHLVSRNESTKLLFSKVAKVKIVAEDQFKRVALAMAKDKQQIKLRNDMQRKFKCKLKNVSTYENSSLGRIKKNYTESVLKKQDIYSKLASTHKATQNVGEMMMLRTTKQQKDIKNKESLQVLANLAAVTKQFALADSEKSFTDVKDLINQILTFYQSQPSIGENQFQSEPLPIDACLQQILQEYSHLKTSIKAQTLHYNELLQSKEDLQQKIGEFQKQEADVISKFQIQALESYKIDDAMKRSYSDKLKKYQQLLKVYFTLLAYLEKNQGEETVRKRQRSVCQYLKQDPESLNNCSAEDESPYPTYITQLHKINQALISETNSLETQSILDKSETCTSSLFTHMVSDVQKWLSEIKRKLSVDYMRTLINRTTSNEYPHQQIYHSVRNSNYKETIKQLHDQSTINEVEKEEEGDFFRETPHKQQNILRSNLEEKEKKGQLVKAKRIKLLQDIDTDYYKMIKSTIRMEKENTRKNYQFTRTFKRTKFSARDNLLEEKRFEASLSVLFTKPVTPPLQRASRKLQCTYAPPLLMNTANETQNLMNMFSVNPITPTIKANKFSQILLLENEHKNRLAEKLKYALSFSKIS